MRWSKSDNYFVSGNLKVYSVDFSLEPLQLVREENVEYDGPKGDDFRNLLLDNGFRVNRRGKTIVLVPKRNDEEYNVFLIEKVVPLGPYGFTNVLSPTQEVKESPQTKNAEVDELHQNWNSEQFRLTMDAITESMKKVFVDVDLKPPAPAKSEDPMISVVGFLEKLRSLFVDKEFSATFLGAANEVLVSIASVFLRRNGLSFDMVKSIPSSSIPSPDDLIKNLIILREFLETSFFIDGSVIVKDFRLMNEKDIPAIFCDSEADVAELHRKEIGAKSIDNIDGKSIFYGYFNIPLVGKFKGVLTRIDVTLPDEIMVKMKLLSQTRPNVLDEKRFWFVKANGEAIFEKSLLSPPESSITDMNRVSNGDGLDMLGFLRRMNKTFVNKEGKYLKFDFSAIKFSGPPNNSQEAICYQDSKYVVFNPFRRVQFDTNEKPPAFLVGRVSLPLGISYSSDGYFEWILRNHLGMACAFEVRGFCFIGKITKDACADFRKKAMVIDFFRDNSELGEDCYVDALARTFFVLNPTKTKWYTNTNNVVPDFIGKS